MPERSAWVGERLCTPWGSVVYLGPARLERSVPKPVRIGVHVNSTSAGLAAVALIYCDKGLVDIWKLAANVVAPDAASFVVADGVDADLLLASGYFEDTGEVRSFGYVRDRPVFRLLGGPEAVEALLEQE